MVDQKLTDTLAELVKVNMLKNRAMSAQPVNGLSNAILASAGLQKPYDSKAKPQGEDPRGPSFVNRVLDVMSRPLYGALNTVKGSMERAQARDGDPVLNMAMESARNLSPLTNPDMLSDLWQGLSGKEKTTGQDILKTTGAAAVMPGPAKFAAGLGIDIAADPLTYVGGIGLFPKIGKAAKGSTEALRAIEEGTAQSSQSIAEQISRRAAQQAVDVDKVAPDEILDDVDEFDRLAPLMPKSAPPAPNVITKTPTVLPRPAFRPPAEGEESMADLLRAATQPKNTVDDLEEVRSAKPLKDDPLLEDDPFPTQVKANVAQPFEPEIKSLGKDDILKLKSLNEQIAQAKSPIVQNILRKEADVLRANIDPSDIINIARTSPAVFPKLTINDRWIQSARGVAEDFLTRNAHLNELNPVAQSNLYNSILNAASKVRKDRRQFHVFQMLRKAEETLLAAGKSFVDAEGIPLRLSDLANAAGGPRALTSKLVDDFRTIKPDLIARDEARSQAFFNNPGTTVFKNEATLPAVQTANDLATSVKQLPPSQQPDLASDISKELSKIARNAGASATEAKTAKAFIDELFDPNRDELYSAVEKQARNLVRQSASSNIDSKALAQISNDVYKTLGANPKVLGKEIQQTRVVEGIMTKFATWWGAKDLKPFSREYIDTARNVASAFAETITPLVRHTTPTQRLKAWAVATGKMSPSDPAEQQLANQFKYMVERLMGTHGITKNAEAVVYRGGVIFNELNDELPKALKFIESKGTDKIGRKFDYTNGNWMHSWKEWEGEPAELLYQLTRAMQMVTRKNAMWDDAAARWGMPVKGGEFQHQVKNVGRLSHTYFPKQIADQIDSLSNQLKRDVFKVPHKSIELFDKVQRMWKTGVTIYSPSHHIRNLNGDIYLAALDGVVSPRPYAIASKVLHAYPTRYKDLESVFNIMDPKLRESALRSRPGNVVLTTKRGEKVTAEQLYQAAESQGLFIRAMHVEDLMGDAAPAFGTLGPKFQPFGGRVYGAATRVSELRDHWVRLAHFADILSKSRQPLSVAIEQASRRVKKFHPDGMDLTGFEQNVLRRIIPFYSWMRKATPLVIEGAIMRPHITLAFPKVMANAQALTGIESEGPGNPFPMDQMFPDWIKEKGIGPVLQPGSGLGRDENWRGEAPGYTIINPTQPFMDQVQQIGSPEKTALSSLTPAARIPMELLTGQTSLGIPLENVEGGTPGYLAQQIPAVGIGTRLTGMTRDNEPWNPEQLLNWLTSAGITGTGPYEAQAQTEYKQKLAELAKKNRGDYR